MKRRDFVGGLAASFAGMSLAGCSSDMDSGRYTQADKDLLAQQRKVEAATAGTGKFGGQVYEGYRGLSRLPWFELSETGELQCIDDSLPSIIDVHAHLGMSVLFEPELDLQARVPRVKHLLDADGQTPGKPLDLDIYINGNFSEEDLRDLQINTLAQGLWGSPFAQTQTIPNLIAEMKAMRVAHSIILPIKMGIPFGDRQTEHWRQEIAKAGVQNQLIAGCSVYPQDEARLDELAAHAAAGTRVIKLHPTVQSFYPDDTNLMPLYDAAEKLGMVVFFHGGRAGIEPESRLRYAMPRHYEAVLANFPKLQVILGHAGARDNAAMLELALRYKNAWLGIHGQGVTVLDNIIKRTGGERLLFGTDWPFYHIGASLAKVLLCTEQHGRSDVRQAILRGNALSLLPELA